MKNKNKSKYKYSGYGIEFDRFSGTFGNEFARSTIVFGIDNSSSSHSDNHKNNIVVLGSWPTDVITDSIFAAEETLL